LRVSAPWLKDDRVPDRDQTSAAEACPNCRRGRPLDVIAELRTTWVTAQASAPLPGYACVVAKRHVEEPFLLPDDELVAFWRESMAVARALDELFRPLKMNYEIHGNAIPHLHLHLFPRFQGDPYEGRAITMGDHVFTRSADELQRMGEVVNRVAATAGASRSLDSPMGAGCASSQQRDEKSTRAEGCAEDRMIGGVVDIARPVDDVTPVFDHDPVAAIAIPPVENAARHDDVDGKPEAENGNTREGDRSDPSGVPEDPANPSFHAQKSSPDPGEPRLSALRFDKVVSIH
jgi:diadenosine tetraphosphate (Ap4A) HIT family hydrolase